MAYATILQETKKVFKANFYFFIQKTLMFLVNDDFLILFLDQLPSMYGPPEEHDLPLRSWHMSDVWGPNGGVSDMSQGGGKADPSVLVRCHFTSGVVTEFTGLQDGDMFYGIIYVVNHVYFVCLQTCFVN